MRNRRAITHQGRPGIGAWLFAMVLAVSSVATTYVVAANAASSHDPVGHLDQLSTTATGINLVGWAADVDNPNPLLITVTANNKPVATTAAGIPRPDVAKALPKFGPNHGFSLVVAMNPGVYQICVVVSNRGRGTNLTFGCQSRTVTVSPIGSLDWVRAEPGAFSLVGSASDPNTTQPIFVDVYADGRKLGRLSANDTFHDGHGFQARYPISQGAHQICVVGINVGPGADAQLRCRSLTLNESPVGAITSIRQVPNSFQIVGWASDPDTTAPISVAIQIDGKIRGTVTANGAGPSPSGHNFTATFELRYTGTYTICAVAKNVSYGSDATVGCQRVAVNFDPQGGIDSLTQSGSGFLITGWAKDPDTPLALNVSISADGKTLGTVLANGRGKTHTWYRFSAAYKLGAGAHSVCMTAIGRGSGGNSAQVCQSITLGFNPLGAFNAAGRVSGSSDVSVTGWATDPETSSPITVRVVVDGATAGTATANAPSADAIKTYPASGANHGFAARYAATESEHRVRVVAVNVGAGADTALGCKIVNAVHPAPPAAPTQLTATAGYGGAVVTWTQPSSDGGAPWTGYAVTANPSGAHVTVGATSTTATVTGLSASKTYTFSVAAINVAGTSAPAISPAVTTLATPPPQTTPAPVSTSRYPRNIMNNTSTIATLRAEGVADARANPSGHSYLILLDIGGQSDDGSGVVLSATTHSVSYVNLVAHMNAYVDGYNSAQKYSAPVVIAIGTNNDMYVNSTAGQAWASQVVNPVLAHAASYRGITIAGANDIEPGFRANYASTQAWLTSYLGATPAPFIFNGSADGCSSSTTSRGCNNGWTMSGLYNLSGGASPTRIISLPQIYNTTMAAQWKYISLTGVAQRRPTIDFGGPLTEWTACDQAGSCGSLTGVNAWTQLWSQLNSSPTLRIGSLPYATDLRIDCMKPICWAPCEQWR